MTDPENGAVITATMNTVDINTDPPCVGYVKRAIENLRNGKAAGIDKINRHQSLLKAEEYLTPTILINILLKNQRNHQHSRKHRPYG